MTRLDDIEKRWEKASSGPWYAAWISDADHLDGRHVVMWDAQAPNSRHDAMLADELVEDDAEAIAHAREDVPWLIEQVRESARREITAFGEYQAWLEEKAQLLLEIKELKEKLCTYPDGLCKCPHFRGAP